MPQQSLIIAHTREMAHQIAKEFRRIGHYLKQPTVRVGCFYGGINVEQNARELKDPSLVPHIVIGTPGRLADLAERRILDLTRV